jgi:hypothetical protein
MILPDINNIRAGYRKITLSEAAIQMGGLCSRDDSNRICQEKVGYVRSRSAFGDDDSQDVNDGGDVDWNYGINPRLAARPALQASSIDPEIRASNASAREINGSKFEVIGGLVAYPRDLAPKEVQKILNREDNSNSNEPSGKSYTINVADSTQNPGSAKDVKLVQHPGILFQGKEYARIVGNPADNDSIFKNGEKARKDEGLWFQVMDYDLIRNAADEWMFDICPFANIPLDFKSYNGDFAQTYMSKFLNEYFGKEIVKELSQDQIRKIIKDLEGQKKLAEKRLQDWQARLK